MQAVIMAGGKGVRLQPYTRILPKPMLPLGDRPILEWLIRRLKAAGVTDVTLAVRHLGYVIRAFFGNGRNQGVQIRYLQEKEPLGTAGPLRLLSGRAEPFLVTNADLVTNLDFSELMQFHREQAAWLTVASQLRVAHSRMGILEADGELVRAYNEKPVRSELTGLGVYGVDPRALAYLPSDGPFDMPELIRALIADDRRVVHFQTQALWFDLGTPAEYEEVAARWSEIEPGIRGE